MGIRLFALPLGLLELALICVVIVLILKWVTGSKNVGRAIGAVLIAASCMLVMLIGLIVSTVYISRSTAPREAQFAPVLSTGPAATATTADEQARQAELQIDQKVKEINQRIDTVDGAAIDGNSIDIVVPDPEYPPNFPAGLIAEEEARGPQVLMMPTPDPDNPDVIIPGKIRYPGNRQVEFHNEDEIRQHIPGWEPSKIAGVKVAGTPWTDDIEEHQGFEADIYPSIHSAAESLGRRVGGDLLEQVAELQSGEAVPVYVWLDSNDHGPATREGVMLITRSVLEAAAEGIRQKLDSPAGVTIEPPASAEAIVVRLSIQGIEFNFHNRWRQQSESGQGRLVADVRTPDMDVTLDQPFEQMPWVAEPSRFVKEYRGGRWLIAYSDGLQQSQSDAYDSAISAAAEALIGEAQARVAQMSPGDIHRYERKNDEDPGWLRERIAAELFSRNHATDQFTQRFERPYGTVWREAILIDAEPGMMDRITDALVYSLDGEATHQRNAWFSIFSLTGLVFGTYLFLNMATKGYYAWSLRLAALAGIIVFGFVFLS